MHLSSTWIVQSSSGEMVFYGHTTQMDALWQRHMDGDLWKDYEPEVSNRIDEAMADGVESFKLPGWIWRNHTFVLDWSL